MEQRVLTGKCLNEIARDAMKERIETNETRIEQAQKDIAVANTNITNLSAQVTTNKNSITNLSAQVTTNKNSITNMQNATLAAFSTGGSGEQIILQYSQLTGNTQVFTANITGVCRAHFVKNGLGNTITLKVNGVRKDFMPTFYNLTQGGGIQVA